MKKLLHNIGKDFGWYFICIFTIVVVWSWVFSFLAVVPPAEKICVFVGSNSANFQQENIDRLDTVKPEYIKKVEVSSYSVKDNMFKTYFEIYGCDSGDIIIIPESKVTDQICISYFSGISERYQEYLPNLGFYKTEGIVFGLKIHDKDTHQSIISCIDYGTGDEEENYYLFFNKDSLHISDLFEADKKSDMDGAIKIVEKLLTL